MSVYSHVSRPLSLRTIGARSLLSYCSSLASSSGEDLAGGGVDDNDVGAATSCEKIELVQVNSLGRAGSRMRELSPKVVESAFIAFLLIHMKERLTMQRQRRPVRVRWPREWRLLALFLWCVGKGCGLTTSRGSDRRGVGRTSPRDRRRPRILVLRTECRRLRDVSGQEYRRNVRLVHVDDRGPRRHGAALRYDSPLQQTRVRESAE